MTTKQDTQFSFEDSSCMEMMSRMMEQGMVDDACSKMMSRFADPQDSGSEFFEMMSQMMASCCSAQQEDEKIIKKV